MTFKEYKKLWALPADIKARESRIEKLLHRKEAIAQDAVHGSAENFPYAATLNMCLQGIVSPATLGIDVGKMSSAEAQREKKDITGMTRNAITDALEKVLPQVVCSMLMTYDLMHSNQAGAYEPKVTFGEYGAPDFDSRVQTIASAATASVMSVEAQVDELWGASKDDDWKRAEVQRILTERGIEDTPEPGIVESLPAGQDTDIPGNDAV